MAALTSHQSRLALASVIGVAVATCLLYRWWRRRPRGHRSSPEVVVVETVEALETALATVAEDTSTFKVMGLDCEWCSGARGHRRPVALLQLATVSGRAFLVRLCKMDSGQLPASLRDLLADRSILKVGVGVLDDGNRLLADYQLATRGCLDLRHLAHRHLPRDLRPRLAAAGGGGLASLAELFLGRQLDKADSVRRGDWECPTLSSHQLRYAAQDAQVALDIFVAAILGRKRASTASGYCSEDLCWGEVAGACQGLVDVKFRCKPSERRTNVNAAAVPPERISPAQVSNAYRPRRSQMYHNCRLLSPDGQLLCTCHRQKAEWYVRKGIGTVDSREPLTVRLNFEPSGMPGLDRAYYQQEKANVCVVCGREDSYIRKNVVPHEYRRHFPERLKKHTSHDVLLLCLPCHQLSASHDRAIRQALADECDAPLSQAANARFREDPERVKARSAAKALQRHRKQGRSLLPAERAAELERALAKFWGDCSTRAVVVDDALIAKTVAMPVRRENADFRGSHGGRVVAAVTAGGLERFERRWRQHFLVTMKPRFLPALWSVSHRHETSAEADGKQD